MRASQTQAADSPKAGEGTGLRRSSATYWAPITSLTETQFLSLLEGEDTASVSVTGPVWEVLGKLSGESKMDLYRCK